MLKEIDMKISIYRKIAIISIVTFLLFMAAYMIKHDTGDYKALVAVFLGIMIAIAYIMSGWKMPQWIVTATLHRVTADDDPSNISPKIYLPLIGLCIITAVVLFFVFCE